MYENAKFRQITSVAKSHICMVFFGSIWSKTILSAEILSGNTVFAKKRQNGVKTGLFWPYLDTTARQCVHRYIKIISFFTYNY